MAQILRARVMVSPSHARTLRARSARQQAEHEAWVRSGFGKRTDEIGSFTIPASVFRHAPAEREHLKRSLTPRGADVSEPLFMPMKRAYEFEWRRTMFEVDL